MGQLRYVHLVIPYLDPLSRAHFARLAGFGVTIDTDCATGNHGLRCTAGGREGEQLEQGMEFDEVAAQFEVVLGHEKSAQAIR